jgi:VWFA-related protein
MALLVVLAFVAVRADAQESASVQDAIPRFQSQSQVVLAPALVRKKSGEIVYGLSAHDFIVEENGVEQDIRLDDSPESQAYSLVVAVQRGGSAVLELEKYQKITAEENSPKHRKVREAALSGLGAMVENFVGDTNSEVAVVTFDSTVDLFQRFTGDMSEAADRLADLAPSGNSGSAILDAVSYSIDLLEHRPKGRTRVLLIISETRDHGSLTKLEDAARRVANSNTLIYSVSFSPMRAETIRDLKGENPAPPGVNPLALIHDVTSAMQKNTARAIAELTGGEYSSFKDKRSFDQDLGELSNHVRNRYLISFQPKNTQPGAHRFTVHLRNPQKDESVLARNSYWIADNAK